MLADLSMQTMKFCTRSKFPAIWYAPTYYGRRGDGELTNPNMSIVARKAYMYSPVSLCMHSVLDFAECVELLFDSR